MPSSPGPDEALIQIKKIGICGTDYHAFKGNQPFFQYPRVLGHEIGAQIVEIGPESNVSQLVVGDRVSLEPYVNCQQCQACRSGYINCCENIQVLGVHADGGMSEFMKVPLRKLHKSDHLSFEQLALVETLAIGLHAVNRGNIKVQDLVLIIGAGPIGLSVAQFAKESGAFVIVADQSQSRLDFIAEHGLSDSQILVDEPLTTERLRASFSGHLPDIVLDATGNKASMLNCFNLPAHGGRLVFVGLFQGEVLFNDPNFHKRELTLMASRNALPSDFKKIIKLIEEGVVDTNPWISHRTEFQDLPTIFPTLLQPGQAVIKAIINV